ncbi:MAG: hypothetical protein Q8R34_01490 [bacterium]|nr:hypothetical protein [bacterium]
MKEQLPLPEKKEITDEQIIDALKLGVEKPEVFKLLQDWTKQQEEKVKTHEDRINLDRKRAKVYLMSGYKEASLESLEAAYEQAWNEQRTELCREILDEIEKITS